MCNYFGIIIFEEKFKTLNNLSTKLTYLWFLLIYRYVSTIGSEGLKPLFVCGSFLMGILTLISTAAERMLGHQGRLLRTKKQWEKTSSWLTIATSFLGFMNLFLVAIFDCRDHYGSHVISLAMFLSFLGVASFTIVSEFYFLDPEYEHFRRLQISYFARFLWSILEVGLIASFVVYAISEHKREGCLLEWVCNRGMIL